MVKKAKAKKAKVEKVKKPAKAKASKVAKKTVKKAVKKTTKKTVKKAAKAKVAKRKAKVAKSTAKKKVVAKKKSAARKKPGRTSRRTKRQIVLQSSPIDTGAFEETFTTSGSSFADATTSSDIELGSAPAISRGTLSGLTAADPKNRAVTDSVNEEMDATEGVGGWTDNGTMNSDYEFNSHSIRAFLSGVRQRLQQRNYVLDLSDNAFIRDCLEAKVFRVKRLVYGKTS